MKDKDFLADADKAQLEITPVAGRPRCRRW